MSQTPLHIALMWHMHQPDYFDPVSGETLMPWTWLHAVKDYGEMLRTLEEVPGATATFNLVPTLLEQLQRYADGTANDRWLRLAGSAPEKLTGAERAEVVQQFFSVHRERHIQPYPRFRELDERRHSGAEAFSDQDLRDLQVWFLLSWTGFTLRRDNPFLAELLERQRLFSEEDKQELLAICHREVCSIIALYRRLETEGRIEISLTPYTHPILPLICNSDIALQASTGEPLPEPAFHFPGDAVRQVTLAHDIAGECLGKRSRGMWPSEGSVSEEALRILKKAGASWAASDEGILAKSIEGGLAERRRLYQPWSYQKLPLVFRDRELSDRIGFLYADWEPERAVDDLLGRLEKAARQAPGGLLTLILDGENCWERYRDNGYPFLTHLYRKLSASTHLKPVTVQQGLQAVPAKPLKQVRPGSWINSDFGIWIGHAEENAGWELLQSARKELDAFCSSKQKELSEVHRALLRAEGSDWFWWFGDDHSTAQAGLFDLLFRRHLQSAYEKADCPVPERLAYPIKKLRSEQQFRAPAGPIRPTLDGQVSSFLEWRGAGHVPLAGSGAMHSEQQGWSELFFGADESYFYLRLVTAEETDLAALLQKDMHIRLGTAQTLEVRWDSKAQQATLKGKDRPEISVQSAFDECLELAVPLADLVLAPPSPGGVPLTVHRLEQGQETGRWPAEGAALLPWTGQECHWMI